jgi:hypothetical protein
MKIVAANGIRIACECFGERNGTVVLLISGLGAQMVRWAPRFCQALAGYGYRIIRFDNRDAGYSPHFDDIPPPDFGALISDLVAGRRPAVPYALTDMAADTIALMDASSALDVDPGMPQLGSWVSSSAQARSSWQPPSRSMVFLLVRKFRVTDYCCDINDVRKLPNPSLSAKIRRTMRGKSFAVLSGLLLAFLRVGSSFADEPLTAQPTAPPADLFTVPDPDPGKPLVFVVYGDMRFTDSAETVAAAPGARRSLVARIAEEHPDALFLNGDVPWHGGQINDYRIYQQETAVWQEQPIRVYPLLGNHEFEQCALAQCLENWWQAFPEFREHRWYAVALGTRVRVLALDSDASLHRGSPQRKWLESEVANLPAEVRFVIVALHHPPIADEGFLMVRSNERSLGGYLKSIARHTSVRFLVCASHVHNYERFEQDGIVYLVSGGGGAKPLAIRRNARDQYRGPSFPNFHFLRFELQDEHLTAEMFRLVDYDAASPHTWAVMDRFDVSATR